MWFPGYAASILHTIATEITLDAVITPAAATRTLQGIHRGDFKILYQRKEGVCGASLKLKERVGVV